MEAEEEVLALPIAAGRRLHRSDAMYPKNRQYRVVSCHVRQHNDIQMGPFGSIAKEEIRT